MSDDRFEFEARQLALRWLRIQFGDDHPIPTPENSGRARLQLWESLQRTAREELEKVYAARARGEIYTAQRPNVTLGDYFKRLLRIATSFHKR